ncbi:hypothetical protein TRIATDRAFT_88358 [Trichoderma atroviride IMI 206040]|uniref:Uncharacterized protein n=1 Tax=Hypocrea atroviridis (strain ATCC 20476 / IMI 206040) TaxID=452589 RepID=G9NXA2_HYPAI|nr:uncharacterized protein TRIATDRAFT_88358 [Trichoderma atroviride IMI 206040]EHK44713.1 hypothetical protein TRIATDRAFT_88358 [Trichoderma atroviride IMI 206040]
MSTEASTGLESTVLLLQGLKMEKLQGQDDWEAWYQALAIYAEMFELRNVIENGQHYRERCFQSLKKRFARQTVQRRTRVKAKYPNASDEMLIAATLAYHKSEKEKDNIQMKDTEIKDL